MKVKFPKEGRKESPKEANLGKNSEAARDAIWKEREDFLFLVDALNAVC